MLKVAIFTCLLAVCYAQPPPPPERPNLPETFMSTFTVFERYRGGEDRGEGKWERSEAEMSFVQDSTITGRDGKEYFSEHLGLFGTHKMYRINKTATGRMICEEETLPEDAKFPMIWDWLEEAHFHRFEDHRSNKTYDAWSEISDERSRTLLVMEGEPNTPVGLMERNRGFEEDRRFTKFEAMAPPANAFTVPTECMKPPPRHH